MGNTPSYQMVDENNEKVKSSNYKRPDIGTVDLTSKYARTFYGLSWFFFILILALIGMAFYLAAVVSTDSETQEAIKWTIPGALTLLLVAMMLYWFLDVYQDLKRADILATDLTRRTAQPFTDASFKKNLTDLVVSRTGQDAQTVYDSINSRFKITNNDYANMRAGSPVPRRGRPDELEYRPDLDRLDDFGNPIQ